ncbi:hypothetical protein DTO013E5_10097 [Penicillium roqueforti]|nr:hypothetical protein DTO012A1_10145 [Penicillium roqueforti]KAI2735373.1 hypothetical protein DTO013F2_10150 [Penicillium roqueforti]KAI2763228.1 hypothetical protein DTO012A8_9555 [Penicillium roqueforti]KAI3196291.1 hypothetical protein DTO013E5_10097 [Penicillium roqueforti]
MAARQRQCVCSSILGISVSTAARIGPEDIFPFSLLAIFEVSIVQYNVSVKVLSVKVVGVVFDDESVLREPADFHRWRATLLMNLMAYRIPRFAQCPL